MFRTLFVLALAVSAVLPSQAAVLLFTEDFEGGTVPLAITGGTGLISTSPVPGGANVANWALGNTSTGDPAAPITLQLSGLVANSAASVQFTFIAVDSWDGLDFTCCVPDYLNIQVNGSSVLQASFRNHQAINYTGDGTPTYGSAPANSSITPVIAPSNYLGSGDPESFYDINISGFSADASGNLTISWFASGAGWQGGSDESVGLDNIAVRGTADTSAPEPGTWLTLSAGFAGLLAFRRRKA